MATNDRDDRDANHVYRACVSEELLAELEDAITVHALSGVTALKAADTQSRYQLITAIRGGQHAELDIGATTFRQKDGVPNRRYLRHRKDSLPGLAASYVGMPFLRDHNTWSQTSRLGTIKTSEMASHGGTGWDAFRMGLRVVKPEAVISVLDGTISMFSIGWSNLGAVFCSVHKQDVRKRGSCSCWPGDIVEVDGASQIVEYEFQKAEGIEVSAVNVPAVKGTKIEDVRAALALELSLPRLDFQTQETRKDTNPMQFARLAAALGLTALSTTDEDRAVQVVEGLRREVQAAQQERDSARTELSGLKTELANTKLATIKVQVDAAINGAYRSGKLRHGRDETGQAIPSRFEGMLRKLAASEGLSALTAELAAMPVAIPVGEQRLNTGGESDVEIPKGGDLSSELKSVASQLGLKEDELLANRNSYGSGQEG